jgi:hypothetical protein
MGDGLRLLSLAHHLYCATVVQLTSLFVCADKQALSSTESGRQFTPRLVNPPEHRCEFPYPAPVGTPLYCGHHSDLAAGYLSNAYDDRLSI